MVERIKIKNKARKRGHSDFRNKSKEDKSVKSHDKQSEQSYRSRYMKNTSQVSLK